MLNHKYNVKNIAKPVSGVVVLDIVTKKGHPVFDFKPGQYLMISYKNEIGVIPDKHAFSIASSPTARDNFSIGIKVAGRFTQGITKLKAGDEVFVSGPFGNFFFNERKHKNIVMIAGGIGITPFMSALRYAADKNLPNKMHLLYSNKDVGGTLFLKEIRELGERNPNMRTLFSITEEKIPGNIGGFVNERFNSKIIGEFIGSPEDRVFFLCGPLGFMDGMKRELLKLGAVDTQIFSEEFSMIPDTGFWPKLKNFSYATGFAGVTMLLPFYFIYNTAQGSALPLFYDSSKIYDAGKAAYEKMISDKKPNIIAIDVGTTNNSTEPKNPAAKSQSAGTKTIKSAAIRTGSTSKKTVNPVTNTAIVSNSVPAPVTHASTVASATEKALATNNITQTNQSNPNSPIAPSPVTSASGVVTSSTSTPIPASTSTPVPASVTTPAPTPVSTPTPVTSASGVTTNPVPPPTSGSVITPAPTPAPTHISRHTRDREDD